MPISSPPWWTPHTPEVLLRGLFFLMKPGLHIEAPRTSGLGGNGRHEYHSDYTKEKECLGGFHVWAAGATTGSACLCGRASLQASVRGFIKLR